MDKKISFTIDHLDMFGQGVFKDGSDIFFIPKTLPGEKGSAQVVVSKKGVNFCKLLTISSHSAQRVDSECPHYQGCSGCHYLHTNYEFELAHKKNQFQRMLSYCQEGIEINTGYGNPCILEVVPIEMSPLYHFLPSTNAFR